MYWRLVLQNAGTLRTSHFGDMTKALLYKALATLTILSDIQAPEHGINITVFKQAVPPLHYQHLNHMTATVTTSIGVLAAILTSNLRVLDIGYEYRTTCTEDKYRKDGMLYMPTQPHFEDTLDKLEVLGFESVDYQIRKPELRWIVDHWPLGSHAGNARGSDRTAPSSRTSLTKDELRKFVQLLKTKYCARYSVC
ncbi:hypothetical protein BGZ81_000194 [Podila clonocystis]|nr:hypothetical protein BGZ81_000194 [Podila clonocystis]